MSMISAQIDELRERAKVLRQGRWSDGADDARLMDDAADTIWQLRDDLQRANAENARLRSELESVGTAAYLYGRGDLQAENAKLRELVRAAWRCIHTGASCSDCRLIAGGCTLQTAMRELGVEVNA